MAMTFTFATCAVVLLIDIAFFGLIIYLIVLLIKALRKYLRSAPVRKEKAETAKTLGEALRQERARCKMTQEFAAESLGVSRQAVSQWEADASLPELDKLVGLSRLFGQGELPQGRDEEK